MKAKELRKKLENTGRLNQVRKDIARVMTAKNVKKSV
jgi:ribosomal protein L29